jgi:hypothetical protein
MHDAISAIGGDLSSSGLSRCDEESPFARQCHLPMEEHWEAFA